MTFLKPAGLVIGASLALSGNALAVDKADVTRALDDVVAALSACDVDKASDFLITDGTVFPPSGTKLLSSAEELDRWRTSCAAGEKVKMTLEDMKVSMNGDLAIVTGLNPGTFTRKDFEPKKFTYRFTAVMKKEGGKWKQYHAHVSAPIAVAAGGEED